MGTIPVSVVIPVLNEEQNLSRCLSCLDEFEQIIVVDSGSTDKTLDIARKYGVVLIDFRWNGKFPKKRNWLLANYEFRTEWVLFLDSDEHLTDAFKSELKQVISTTIHSGFWLFYDNFFMGKLLRFGVPQRKLALFKKNSGQYEKIDEDRWSTFDMEIHEHPQIRGSVGNLESRIVHRDFKSLSHFIERHNEYSDWEARRLLTLDRKCPTWKLLSGRQRIKYALVTKEWFPLAYFIFTYLVRLGFLDGRAGFRYAVMKMIYFYHIALKIRELRE
jgi:glycosyltransferase involved in cell wall biosynthesis